MADFTGKTMRGLDAADQWLYRQTVPRANQFRAFANRSFEEAAVRGVSKGMRHFATGLKEVSGAGYLWGATRHYAKAAGGAYAPTFHLTEMGERFGRFAKPMGVAGALGRRALGVSKVLLHGLAPATVIHFAMQDEMGFGVGLAKETAAWGAFMAGGSIGLQMGGWAAARTGAAVGGAAGRGASWALGKIPGVRKIGTTALGRTLGKAATSALGSSGRLGAAAIGGAAGFVLGAVATMELARWGVGFALHTLPTFAKQFRADMTNSGYGGDYVDSAGAVTMRQRSLQAMGRSHVNARSAFGQEASLMHV